MNKMRNITALLIISLLIVSCGQSNPTITRFVAKSDRLGVVLDTKDSTILSELQTFFDEKEEKPDASPDFRYLIDLSFSEKNERWQYSIEGYIRNYDEDHAIIYKIRDVIGFNRIAKIR